MIKLIRIPQFFHIIFDGSVVERRSQIQKEKPNVKLKIKPSKKVKLRVAALVAVFALALQPLYGPVATEIAAAFKGNSDSKSTASVIEPNEDSFYDENVGISIKTDAFLKNKNSNHNSTKREAEEQNLTFTIVPKDTSKSKMVIPFDKDLHSVSEGPIYTIKPTITEIAKTTGMPAAAAFSVIITADGYDPLAEISSVLFYNPNHKTEDAPLESGDADNEKTEDAPLESGDADNEKTEDAPAEKDTEALHAVDASFTACDSFLFNFKKASGTKAKISWDKNEFTTVNISKDNQYWWSGGAKLFDRVDYALYDGDSPAPENVLRTGFITQETSGCKDRGYWSKTGLGYGINKHRAELYPENYTVKIERVETDQTATIEISMKKLITDGFYSGENTDKVKLFRYTISTDKGTVAYKSPDYVSPHYTEPAPTTDPVTDPDSADNTDESDSSKDTPTTPGTTDPNPADNTNDQGSGDTGNDNDSSNSDQTADSGKQQGGDDSADSQDPGNNADSQDSNDNDSGNNTGTPSGDTGGNPNAGEQGGSTNNQEGQPTVITPSVPVPVNYPPVLQQIINPTSPTNIAGPLQTTQNTPSAAQNEILSNQPVLMGFAQSPISTNTASGVATDSDDQSDQVEGDEGETATTSAYTTNSGDDGEVLSAENDREEWALLNVILTVIMAIVSLLTIIGGSQIDKATRRMVRRLATLIPVIGGLIALYFTESFSGNMIMVNLWTILFAALVILQLIIKPKPSQQES